MREDQRDGLRVLVVDELGELLRIGLLDGVEGGGVGAQRLGEAVEQALGVLRLEGLHEQLAREIDAAARHVVAGVGDVVEFVQHGLRPAPPKWR